MNRRKGVLAFLSGVIATYTGGVTAMAQDPKPKEDPNATTLLNSSSIWVPSKTWLVLDMDSMAEEIIEVRFAGETLKITRKEVMDALRVPTSNQFAK